MTNLEERDVRTPCKNLCHVPDHQAYCTGCLRSLEEISSWISYSDEMRDQIIAELPARKARLSHVTIKESAQ